nr:MAG TPA: hypothetical protein [Bacteriophage sp.]
MARYALTHIWSYNGGISGECLGVYPTKEKAQEAMKKAVVDNKFSWIEFQKDFELVERSRVSSITSLVDTDWDKFLINEIEIDD